MADWTLPALTSNYTDVLNDLKNRDENNAKMFDGTSDTNLPVGVKRWNSTNARFEKWDGSAWGIFAALYNINVAQLGGHDASYFAQLQGDATKTFKVANAVNSDESSALNQVFNMSNGKAILLPEDTNLENWADALPNSGIYNLSLTTGQGALPLGWWYIEYIRHSSDTSSHFWHFMRATSLGAVNNPNETFINTRQDVGWVGWKKVWNEDNDGVSSGLDADLLDGYDSSDNPTSNTIALRTADGDIEARLFKSAYPAETTVPTTADICFRINASPDDYMRFMSSDIFKAYCDNIGVGAGIGVNQTWQDETANRVAGTTYTNTYGKPISVAVIGYYNGTANNSDIVLYIDGVIVSKVSCTAVNQARVIVPPNSTYKLALGGNVSSVSWFELK